MQKLVNSDSYRLFAEIKGTNPTAWNWQAHERALGMLPPTNEEIEEEYGQEEIKEDVIYAGRPR